MDNVHVVVKVCPTHGDLTEADIKTWVWEEAGKTYRRCKACIQEKNQRYEARKRLDPEYVEAQRERNRKRWIAKKPEITAKRKTPERLAKRREQYHTTYKPKALPKCKAKQAEYKAQLADPYVKRLIQNNNKAIRIKDIPQVLVEFKRTLIQFKHAIKQRTTIELDTKIKELRTKCLSKT